MLQTIYDFWGINSEHIVDDKFTGYEALYSEFDKLTKEAYDADPDSTIDRAFTLYRSVNLVPIVYFTEEGIQKAIRQFRGATYQGVERKRLGLGNNRGQELNRFIFTNMMTAEPKGRGSNSLRDRFYNDTKLRRAIRICFEFRDGDKLVYPTAVRRALELVTGENITNFKPQSARAIVEHLCPVIWGRVYDYSCGYGGRLLGTCTSNFNYTYVGTDPNTETHERLKYLSELGNFNTELHCLPSQDFQPEDIDLAFSSPPYFNLEKYSDEPTQCMVQFQTLDDWFDGYVASTIKNVYNSINDDGVFATNIADYKIGKENFEIVDRWIETSELLGFKHVDTIKMKLNTRPGVGNDKLTGREKYEGIYVFTKR